MASVEMIGAPFLGDELLQSGMVAVVAMANVPYHYDCCTGRGTKSKRGGFRPRFLSDDEHSDVLRIKNIRSSAKF